MGIIWELISKGLATRIYQPGCQSQMKGLGLGFPTKKSTKFGGDWNPGWGGVVPRYGPGTLNNHFLMDVWWNNHFVCNDLESSNWNNHKKTGCLEFQGYVSGSKLVGVWKPLWSPNPSNAGAAARRQQEPETSELLKQAPRKVVSFPYRKEM